MYGVKETEEMAKESKDFLKIFQEFFKNTVDALPKEQKTRGQKRQTVM
jgi:hypothetical protein